MSNLDRINLWENIPQELKDNCRWGMATLAPLSTERPYKVDKSPRNPFTGKHLSPAEDEGWVTFEEVISKSPEAIGIRLTSNDPYTVIDIDKYETPEQQATAAKIIDGFKTLQTYVERSVGFSVNQKLSKQGFKLTEDELSMMTYHVIVKGEPSEAMVRKPIELYSQNRFIILTGDIIKKFNFERDSDNKIYAVKSIELDTKPKPILEGGAHLVQLKKLMSVDKSAEYDQIELKTHAERERDDTILRRMFSGQNGAVYERLFKEVPSNESTWAKWALAEAGRGKRSAPDISHSGHEMALANRIVFQTQNPEQFLRIFKSSKVYRGKKTGYATQESYENKYLKGYTFKAALTAYHIKLKEDREFEDALSKEIERSRTLYDEYKRQQKTLPAVKEPLPPIEKPSGLIGDIAQFIYDSSHRPLWEAAITGALMLVAAIAGRENNINGSGLSLYTIIVAGSGRGKESAVKGALRLLDAICEDVPAANIFRGASHTASGQAIHAMLARGISDDSQVDDLVLPSKLVTFGEVSTTLGNMTGSDVTEYNKTLKKVLLDAWGKSSYHSKMEAMVYSDNKKAVPAVKAPNLCIIADTTPDTLSEVISIESVRDGFYPRWSLIEYRGGRPKPNVKAHLTEPDQDMLARLKAITISVLRKNREGICTNINLDDEAMDIYQAFEQKIDDYIAQVEEDEGSANEFVDIWNRAGLKSLRIAGILAVGKDHIEPTVTKEDMNWAISLVERDMKSFTDRIEAEQVRYRHEERVSDMHGFILRWFNELDTSQKIERGAKQWQIDQGVLPMSIVTDEMYSRPSFIEGGKWERSRTFDQFMDQAFQAAWKRGLITLHRQQEFDQVSGNNTHGSTVANQMIRLGDARTTYDFKNRR